LKGFPLVDKQMSVVFSFFFFYFYIFFYIIYSLLMYEESHVALAMAKTKSKIQNKQAKKSSIADHLQKGP